MGVYIKGATIDELKRAGIAGVSLNMKRLVEVPEPHGRLIDECKISKKLIYVHEWHSDREIQAAIIDAPTVIEAEGK